MNSRTEIEIRARQVVQLWRAMPRADTQAAVVEHMAKLSMALAELEKSLQALDAQERDGDSAAQE